MMKSHIAQHQHNSFVQWSCLRGQAYEDDKMLFSRTFIIVIDCDFVAVVISVDKLVKMTSCFSFLPPTPLLRLLIVIVFSFVIRYEI